MDLWIKDVAPSPELAGGSTTTRPGGMNSRGAYRAELGRKKDVVDELRQKCRDGIVTFVYAARDEQHNGALVLRAHLEHHDT